MKTWHVVAVVTGIALGVLVRWLTRSQSKDYGSAVSPQWLNENSYKKRGDERQWK